MKTNTTPEKSPYRMDAHLGMPCRQVRAINNRAERAMVGAWAVQMQSRGDNHSVLNNILGEQSTERDARVAATVIQWLGSGKGQLFLADALKGAGVAVNWTESGQR